MRSAVLGVDGNGLGAILGIELIPIGVAVQAGVGYDAHQVRGGSAFSVIIGAERLPVFVRGKLGRKGATHGCNVASFPARTVVPDRSSRAIASGKAVE